MNSQLYTAASGLLVEERRLELISNNLANARTPGFRPQRPYATLYQRFGAAAADTVRAANAGVALAGTYEVPGPGPRRATGHPLDVALESGEFLVVETAAGRRYTRAGNLQASPTGELLDGAGHRVVGTTGQPITGLRLRAAITTQGQVTTEDNEIGRLLIVRDPRQVLRREGGNLLTADGQDAELDNVADPQVHASWLESSGTDPMRELVELIEAQRAFENYQKLVNLTMNEVNRRAANDLAG